MKEIELTQGQVALVDDEDFERVNAYSWHTKKIANGKLCAGTNMRVDGGGYSIEALHRFVMNAPSGRAIQTYNGNYLDCRKENLHYPIKRQYVPKCERLKMTVAEKAYAAHLDACGAKYVFPCFQIALDGSTYRPDFYLPEVDTYVEVVGTRQAYSFNKDKYAEFRAMHPEKKFIVVDRHGKRWEARDHETCSYEDYKAVKYFLLRKRTEWNEQLMRERMVA